MFFFNRKNWLYSFLLSYTQILGNMYAFPAVSPPFPSIPFSWPEISLHFLRDGYVSLRLFIEVTTARLVCRVLSARGVIQVK